MNKSSNGYENRKAEWLSDAKIIADRAGITAEQLIKVLFYIPKPTLNGLSRELDWRDLFNWVECTKFSQDVLYPTITD